MACEGKESAEIFFGENGLNENFISQHPPVEVHIEEKLIFSQCSLFRWNCVVRSRGTDFPYSGHCFDPVEIRLEDVTDDPGRVAPYLYAHSANVGAAATAVQCLPNTIIRSSIGGKFSKSNNPTLTSKFTYIRGSSAEIEKDWDLIILDTRGEVFRRTFDTKPEYQIKCSGECPPDTCECRHGNRVCCYSSTTGVLVKSFLV